VDKHAKHCLLELNVVHIFFVDIYSLFPKEPSWPSLLHDPKMFISIVLVVAQMLLLQITHFKDGYMQMVEEEENVSGHERSVYTRSNAVIREIFCHVYNVYMSYVPLLPFFFLYTNTTDFLPTHNRQLWPTNKYLCRR